MVNDNVWTYERPLPGVKARLINKGEVTVTTSGTTISFPEARSSDMVHVDVTPKGNDTVWISSKSKDSAELTSASGDVACDVQVRLIT